MKNKILIINGPNLNLLGKREPEIYGYDTLLDIRTMCMAEAEKLGLVVDFRQSNFEGEIINWVHESVSCPDCCGLIINAAGLTHTSISIMDALQILQIPVIEVHMSNVFKREEFRHISYISKASLGVISGFGANSYLLAINALYSYLN